MSQTWQDFEGKVINEKFLLVRCLGGSPAGGFFQADAIGSGEHSVIKIVPLQSADPEAAEAQLLRLQAAETLSHPNVIRILDVGRWDSADGSYLFLRMEHAEETLAQLLPQRTLSNQEAKFLLESALGALEYLHSQGFVHGHIQPSKIMAIGDTVKLSSDRLYRVGEVIEEASVYVAPEAASEGATAASDSWSLGVALAEALTGQQPVWDKRSEPLLPATVPPQFREIIRHCLRSNPAQRWGIPEIRAALSREPSQQHQIAAGPPPGSPAQPAKRSYVLASAVAIGVIAVAGFALMGDRSDSSQNLTPVPQQSAEVAESPAASPQADEQDTPAPQVSQRAVQKQPVEEINRGATRLSMKETPATGSGEDRILHREMPDVSQRALNTITGTLRVRVRVRVNSSGVVESASFASQGPSRYFAERSLRAARLWKFSPQAGENPSEWLLRFQYRKRGAEVIAEQAGS